MSRHALWNYAAAPAIAAAAIAVSLGTAGSAAAMGDAPDARYERYIQQEGTKQAAGKPQGGARQSVSSAPDMDEGGDSHSPLRNSPYHIRNIEQHQAGHGR